MLEVCQRSNLAIAFVIVGMASGGCVDDPYQRFAPVTGSVMCDGKPAAGGVLAFTPVDAPEQTGRPPGNPGASSIAVVGEDGRFVLKRVPISGEPDREGALVGPHQVTFQLPRTTPAAIHPDDKANLTPEELEKLKARLGDEMPVFKPLACGAQISPGTVEVKSGPNDFQFTLQPASGPKKAPQSPPPSLLRRRGG